MTLLQLQEMISEAVHEGLPQAYWVSAEISQISVNASGHCYIDLVQSGSDGKAQAKARAIIWRSRAELLLEYFRQETGQLPSKGMKILLNVEVEHSPLWGLSLIVYDLDPTFTLGEVERQRQITIDRLQQEGMFDINSQVELPSLPGNIAVISAEGAAGYGDFLKHISQSAWAGAIKCTLFSSPMQGEECPCGIISALMEILQHDSFDAVVIIRGGGSSMDLRCFDDYELALNVAQYPLPVLTGIGHERDYHVIDMVAHSWFKTPTAVADFLIESFQNEWEHLQELSARVVLALEGRISGEERRIDSLVERMKYAARSLVDSKLSALALIEQRIEQRNPLKLLSGGYSILLDSKGKRISKAENLPESGRMSILFDGVLAEYEVTLKSRKKL